jgi:hypothetical protein
VQVAVVKAGNVRDIVKVPLSATVIAPAWYYCWRYEIGLALLAIVLAFIAAGIYMPSRFKRGVGVQVSNTPQVDEGVLYLIRAVRGSRSRFYRDARVYLTMDYRVAAKPRGAVARLRADRSAVMIRPESGARISRKSVGLKWEPLEPYEVPMEPGVAYKAGDDSLYFEFRAQ